MKKGLKFVLALTTLLAAPITLTSCGEEPKDSITQSSGSIDEDLTIVNAALSALTVNSQVDKDFTLVTQGMGNVAIAWTSDNAAITINGSEAKVTRSTEADVNVKLTATATKGSATATRDFTVKVLKQNLDYELSTVAEAKSAAVGSKVYIKGIVGQECPYSTGDDIFESSLYIVDTTGALYVFSCAKICIEVEEGDEIVLCGVIAEYKSAKQLTDAKLEVKLSSNNELPLNNENVIEGETIASVMAMTESIAGNIYKLTGTLEKISGSTYVNYRLKDEADNYINVYFDSSKAGSYSEIPQYKWLDEYVNKEITCAFIINSANSSGKWRGHILHVYDK